jgi:hypothetical protein
MKCPHCGESVGLLSKEMNYFGRDRPCPHCQKTVRLFLDFKIAALWIVPILVLSLVLKSMFGNSSAVGTLTLVCTSVTLVLLSTRLKV